MGSGRSGRRLETVMVDIQKGEQRKPAYLAIHPQGVVPVMTFDGVPMFESAAITLYLAETSPMANLVPKAPHELRQYYQWAVYGPAEIDPHLNTLVPHTLLLPPDQRNEQLADSARKAFGLRAKIVSAALEGNRWLLGDTFSAADIVIGHDCAWARMLGVIDDYPTLCDYLSRCEEREAFKRVWGGKVRRFPDPHAA